MVAGGLGLVLGTACSPDTVRISYRPATGDVAVYRTSVQAVTVTTIGDEQPKRRVTTSVLTARHRVLESGPDGSRVEVRLSQDGADSEDPTTFVVRFDRAGQLAEVERVEGLPAGALGDLSLSELFPAAAAAPPRRPLAPGDRWTIDGPVQVAANGADPARLTGRGRLVALTVAGGRPLATVDSSYRMPVSRSAADTGGRLTLDGTLVTKARVAHDLDDHQVQSVESKSSGLYSVTLVPPPGVAGVPVPGTLTVEVASTSRRVG